MNTECRILEQTWCPSNSTAGELSSIDQSHKLSDPQCRRSYGAPVCAMQVSIILLIDLVAMAASTPTSSMRMLLLVCAVLLGAFQIAHAADPDPLQDFCVADMSATATLLNGFPCKPRSNVTAKDFTYSGLRQPVSAISDSETGAIVNLATVNEFPGLNTMGVSHARLDFAIGGVVPLHTHPRATETLLVLKGFVYTGFISDDNVLYASTLQQGDFTIFPRALQHFQLNVGNETAITFNTLTSQNPGFLVTANQIFVPNITIAVIEKSFGVDAATATKLKNSIPRYWG